jgi:hypothetical protein
VPRRGVQAAEAQVTAGQGHSAVLPYIYSVKSTAENPAHAEPGHVIQVTPTEFDRRTGKYRHLARTGTRIEIADRWGEVREVLTAAGQGRVCPP